MYVFFVFILFEFGFHVSAMVCGSIVNNKVLMSNRGQIPLSLVVYCAKQIKNYWYWNLPNYNYLL